MRTVRQAILVATLLLLIQLVVVPGASAGVHTVTNGNDNGPGSYRQAIIDAGGDSDPVTIDFNAGLKVALTSGDVDYNNNQPITLNGNGSTIDGSGAHQILRAFTTPSVTVNDLTMQNGATAGDGGALEGNVADIIVINSMFIGNSAGDDGGAIRTSGGSYTITNSTFSGNSASSDGGATRTSGGSYTITNSTFSGNSASDHGGGARTSTGSYTITNSTFSGNSASGEGGVARTAGGSYTITNSTFSGNSAGSGGGAIRAGGDISLTYVTLAGNTSPRGANLIAEDLITYGAVITQVSGDGCDLDGSTTSNGFNYSTDDSCGLTGTGDTENGGDPMLGPPADNGGPTETRLPQPGSPLIDAIPTADCNLGVTADQRGVTRPQGPDCDIGAAEVEAEVEDEFCSGFEGVEGNHIIGTDDDDVIIGSEGRDIICTFGGDDVVEGHGGDDIIDLGAGDDRAFGGEGNDLILGRAGNDVLEGGPGNDVLRGGPGTDRLRGDQGADLLIGDKGNDILAGGPGKDVLRGNAGDDLLRGGGGNDKLFGGPGDDVLDGGPGKDLCRGGPGRDKSRRCER